MDKTLKCKFAWSHLDFVRNEYAPCFRFRVTDHTIAKMSEKLPSEVINSDEMKNVRKSLQEGVFPPGCFDCQYKESKGLKSYRLQSLQDTSWDSNNEIDYSLLDIKKIYDLELKFSRACNFLCRHCNSEANSSFEVLGKKNIEIASDLNKMGFNHLIKAESPIPTVTDDIVEDLIKNIIPNIERLFFSGGEPLYHIEHYRFLERLINDPKIDTKKIILGYNTNMSLINFKDYDLKKLWQHFKGIELTISLDGTGIFFNYFRERGDYDTVIKNIISLVESVPYITDILLVCTCTSYHAFYADKIFKDISELVDLLKNKYKIPYVHTKPTFVHLHALDMVNLDDTAKKYIIDNLTKTMDTENYWYNKALSEIIKHLSGESYGNPEWFKKTAKLQDKLHSRDPFIMAPRVAEYVYNNKLIW